MTMNRSDEASLLAEAHDLVSDRALPCELCRRRMRYFPVRGQVTVRAFGARLNWRCMQCVAGGHMMASLLSGEGIVPADSLKLWAGMAADLLEQCEERSRAHAKRPRPLFAAAVERWYSQLQIAGEEISSALIWVRLPLALFGPAGCCRSTCGPHLHLASWCSGWPMGTASLLHLADLVQ